MTSTNRFEKKTVFHTLFLSLILALFANPTWADADQSGEDEDNQDTTDTVEGDDEDIAFVKVKTLNENVWICANCFGICKQYTNDDVNGLFMGSFPATKKKWVASQVIDSDYLEAVKKGIID